jgi:hypothetical protein
MGVFDWIGMGESILGPKNSKIDKELSGSWSVTIGTAIQGNYGTTLQSYYGPYITHCVDTSWLGLGFLANRFLNELAPGWPIPEGTFSQFGGNVLGSLFSGIGGYVTWVYGPNITATYGGPTGTITRAKSFTKTAYPSDPLPLGLLLGKKEKALPPAPAGSSPNGVDAVALANKDKKVLLMVNLLSWVLNLTIAALELAVKFEYSSYHPNPDPDQNNILEQPNPSEDNYPLGGINFILGAVPPRIMAFIYTVETAGSFEFWGPSSAKKAKDHAKDVLGVVGISPGTPEMLPYSEAKTKHAVKMTQDSIDALVLLIAALVIVVGFAASSKK